VNIILYASLVFFYSWSQNCYKRLLVCPPIYFFAYDNLASTGQILMEFDICEFLENLSGMFKLH